MKLNLGCGNHILDNRDWDNIDFRQLPGVDTVCKIENLIQPDNSCEEIYAGHILEHLDNPLKELRRWYDWLRVGGILWIVIPEKSMVYEAIRRGIERHFTADEILHGRDQTGGGHKHVFTKANFINLLKKAEIKDYEIIPPPYQECPYMMSKIGWQLCCKIVKSTTPLKEGT